MGLFDDGGFAASLVNAGASIGTTLLNNAANRQAAGSAWSNQMAVNQMNYDAQKEFAQHGIRWRVADAKAAGLHPLAALGASPLGFSPSFQSSGFTPSSDWSGVGNAIGQMGQYIGRAIDAKATEKERAEVAAYESEARKLDIENKQLQNDSLRQRMIDNALASMQAVRNQAGQPPAMQQVIPTGRDGRTLPGQGDAHTSKLTEVKPAELVASHPQTPFAEAGSHPETLWTRTADGGYAPMRGQAIQQALEDDVVGSIRYNVRNGLGAFISDQRYSPPREYLPRKGRDPDYFWVHDNIRGTWYPAKHSSGSLRNLNRAFGNVF